MGGGPAAGEGQRRQGRVRSFNYFYKKYVGNVVIFAGESDWPRERRWFSAKRPGTIRSSENTFSVAI